MKLTTTQIALLDAIKASLFGIEPNYPADTDWSEVVKEAKAQTVLGIISPVIPVKDVSVEMGKATYMRLLFEQDKLIKLLYENDIPQKSLFQNEYFLLKRMGYMERVEMDSWDAFRNQ